MKPFLKTVSASKLESFQKCPKMFYIKYIENKEEAGEKTESMHFGIMIHNIINEFNLWVKNGSLPKDLESLKVKAYNIILDIINRNLNKYRDKIFSFKTYTPHKLYKDFLSHYLKYFFDNKLYNKHFDTELEFKVPIDQIISTIEDKSLLNGNTFKYKDVYLHGKIDFIIYPDYIIDFKIQKKKSFRKSFLFNFQTYFYTLIYPRDMFFSYMFIWEGVEFFNMKLGKETRAEKLNFIADFIDIINNTNTFLFKKRECKRCIFNKYCNSKI